MTNESLVIEVVEWLEKAAHDTDLERIARSIRERKLPFAIFNIVIRLSPDDKTLVEYVVKHPVTDFQNGVGLTDNEMELLRDFVVTNANTAIKIGFEMSKEHGELLCLSQLNYVPRGNREQAIQEVKDVVANITALADEVTVARLPTLEYDDEEQE